MTAAQLETIKRAISRQQTAYSVDFTKSIRAFLSGDHWQDGAGWSGPRPKFAAGDTKGAEEAARVLNEIQRTFVSQNLIGECAVRHADSVATEPSVGVSLRRELGTDHSGTPEQPTDEEKARMREANAAITAWMDARDLMRHVHTAVKHTVSTGRGVLRLFIPASATEVDATGARFVPRATLEEVITRVYLHAPDPESAGVTVDIDGNPQYAYLYFKDLEDKTRLELQYTEGQRTVIAIEGQDGAYQEVQYPLAGALLTYEMTRASLFTPQVVSLQKLINKVHTMLSRNTDTAGFLERTIENGVPPGHEEQDPNRPNDPDARVFIRTPYQTGAGVTNFLAPYVFDDGKGNKVAIPARANFREPVSVNTFVDSIENTERAFYKEVKQLHVLLSGDASSSGRSRQQAMNDYRSSLRPTVDALNGAMRWLFNTVLRLGAHFAGDAERFAGLRAVATTRPEVTFVDGDEIRTLIEMHAAGLISRESAMLATQRVTDPQAERAALKTESLEDRGIGDANKRRDSISQAVQVGLYSQAAGLRELGVADTDVQRIIDERLTETAALEAGIGAGQ
ncbi:MAG: hypothetical protein HC933_12770, partial [Pleurocapsa sp. SU_196_0]|nr:hypothetical protein [Pleurocapsa sp. SU_196_0]